MLPGRRDSLLLTGRILAGRIVQFPHSSLCFHLGDRRKIPKPALITYGNYYADRAISAILSKKCPSQFYFCPVPETETRILILNLAGTKGKFWFTHEPKQCSESGSVSQRYIRIRIRILPSSNKNSKNTLNFYCFVTSSWLFICKEWCKCTFKK